MKVLLVGSGGREHALAWKLSQEAEVVCVGGNPGIANVCECLPFESHQGIGELCLSRQPDLVVVGPENPLIEGLADTLIGLGFPVFGPQQNAAQLEASKAFSKNVMESVGVPTAKHGTFSGDPVPALEYVRQRFAQGAQVAVKASGNALGKGVVVCESEEEATEAVLSMMRDRELGSAGDTVVIEDRLIGREFSLLTVVSGRQFFSLPVAQDYKRALNGDRGPNTGGMGSVSPARWVTDALIGETESRIVEPTLHALSDRGIEYRGVLFSGIMVVDEEPFCLEYNVRFGDPETQSIMTRLGPGFAELLFQAATGGALEPVKTLDREAYSVVLASAGYPGKIERGHPITLGSIPDEVTLFHAGTAVHEGQLVTHGGRVLCVTAPTRDLAYQAVEQVHFEGKQFRSDIGA